MLKKFFDWVKGLLPNKKEVADPQGISEFKALVKNGLKVATTAKDAKADGVITKGEWIKIGASAVPLLKNFANWKLLKAQALDFTTDEGRELADYAVSLGILRSDAREAIDHVIAIAEGGQVLYEEHVNPLIVIIKRSVKK